MKKTLKLLIISLFLSQNLACACTPAPRELPEVKPDKFSRYTSDIVMSSKILGKEIKYSVYLPQSYISEKDKRYPVVYMCHGYGDNNNSWKDCISSINIAEKEGDFEMIYVFPQAFNSYYSNRYDGSYNYMDMFIQELIPQVDATLRTISDREHRFITGYSMGGFGAMVLPMKHPEMFSASAPLSMSFRTDEMYMTESKDGWNSQWGSIFGGYNTSGQARITDYYKAHCPLYQFNDSNHDKLDQVHWFLTCGDDEERLLIANDTLHVIMRDHGYKHDFRVADGAHTSSYWRSALLEVLPMFWYYANGGEQWPGMEMQDPEENKTEFSNDGSVASDGYLSEKKGTAIYVFHESLDDDLLKRVLRVINTNKQGSNYILLPCDLSQKTVGEWLSTWSELYPSSSSRAVALKGAGRALFENREAFVKSIFIEASIAADPSTIEVKSSDNLVYVCSDNFAWYRDMDILYHSCKTNNSNYQYRVIKSSDNEGNNLLRCTEKAKTYIIY